MTYMHRVGVHYPRHDTLIRVHVGSRHVGVRSQGLNDSRSIATGETLELARAHRVWITDDAALRSAERNVDDRALPCHPGSERFHFLQRHLHVESDSTLRGTA